ncbi:MAG TPA: translation elongation factor Ts [Coriobacteriia bacterium]|nr:translation elongation factor Ts [Coriobacteriia bacterium]
MGEITARMVKDLRECTGAGMMDCKRALAEADGDVETAIDILRTKGLAALAKKAGRATNEGVIGGVVTDAGHTGVLVEVNCETDFVARNADFRAFVNDVARHIASAAPDDLGELFGQAYIGRPAVTVEHYLGEAVAKLGENMGIARFARYGLSADAGGISVYIHGVGNIGVMVELSAGTPQAAADELFGTVSKDIAMHIAATAPVSVRRDQVPADVVAHEMAIYRAQAVESGKPEQVQEKIAAGRLEKYFREACLLEQPFVKNPDITVEQHLAAVAASLGSTLEVVRFTRYVLGETSSAS